MGNEEREEKGTMKEGSVKKNDGSRENIAKKTDPKDRINMVECKVCGSKSHKSHEHKAKHKALEGMKK